MLIKEYRIPLPLSVEEYRIAQLYMIAKKSRQESSGSGSGVEIFVNEPYEDGPGGQGQFTHKIYHVGSHLPGWLKSLVPKSALTVEEEAWNAYPYTKTRYTCPFVDRFSLEIETKYFDDAGDKENVFELSGNEIRNRQIDLIDVVRDQLPPADYIESEDPTIYKSEKSQRGPLDENWIDEHRGKTIMCAYKLCKVEFRYWGMQTKIERFIHDVALRKTMLRAHRQAWAWQDEWLGLTMEDVRRIEAETQAELARKMATANRGGFEGEAQEGSQGDVDLKSIDADSSEPLELQSVGNVKDTGSSYQKAGNIHKPLSVCPSLEGKRGLRSGSRHTLHSPGDESWRMVGIERDSDSESEEFFDAEDFEEAAAAAAAAQDVSHSPLAKWSSVEMVQNNAEASSGTEESIFAPSHIRRTQERAQHSHLETTTSGHSSPAASPGHQMALICPTSVLVLVLHGGYILDHGLEQGQPKSTDVATFAHVLEAVIKQHYPTLQSRIVTRLVACPAMCAEALAVLSNLSPFSFQSSPSFEGISYNQNPLPIAALPLFAVSTPEYVDYLNSTIMSVNTVYHDFLKSPEGLGFTGQVVLIGDSLGAILAFDAVSRSPNQLTISGSHFGSETSLQESKSNPLISISNDAGTGELSDRSATGGERRCVTPAAILANPTALAGDIDSQMGAGFFNAPSFQKLLSAQIASQRPRSNSTGSENRLEFEPSDLFMFGSPVALILSYRKMVSGEDKAMPIVKAGNTQVYNLFHPTDLLGLRVEPLISAKFAQIPPVTVPRFQKYPLGDGQPIHLLEFMQSHAHLFSDTTAAATGSGGAQHSQSSTPAPPFGTLQSTPALPITGNSTPGVFATETPLSSSGGIGSGGGGSTCCSKAPTPTPPAPSPSGRRTSEASISSTMSGLSDAVVPLSTIQTLSSRWWGNKRIDYALYCPEGLANFPAQSLPHLFHASYWESSDVASFVIRQLVRCDSVQRCLDSDAPTFSFVAGQPREKWNKKRTSVKIKNVTANHRANDVIVKEGAPQQLSARFVYGPLDMVNLSGEKVDIHVMRDTRTGEWTLLGTEQTDKSGRVSFLIPHDKALSCGLHPVKMVVRGDHTTVDFFLTVVPPKTEAVVFSIDGSFTASVSVSGRDPKVRAGAVDVVRHWQELGYLIIYITGRPDMQQRRVVAWLVQHNFPHGLVSFVEGLSTGPLQHKTDYLRKLQNEAEIIYHAAYGSAKDISVYSALGIAPEKIFIAGKVAKKLQSQATPLTDGYAQHLSDLRAPGSAISARPAQGNARMLLSSSVRGPGGAYFGFHGLLPKRRRSAKRTSSYPLPPRSPNAAGSNTGIAFNNSINSYATPSHKYGGNSGSNNP
ncbi:protein retinal degeneration B-like isoform X1 [Varroa destructor]|uniref:DDHD domain-containing protein n=1 Tax=Varroa destructor TaxID=109461 RepID=A0A7M7JEX1_VARDE|nr:protein retinal degeneration B-like isoform X1 [Varroa destructor]XP_022651081.1 protein retinal degeneration B-like isoform X1 [Varroa destructor]XP_022651082.1 protein retinal degeneration B-like isoform X1 [Varroa destructor]XP_022651083.1 protein retinal degeneration B-like isoform X1 [Varroa destructor]XP_022651084.1 protein retinal degeneration B-like isoform X1 [Varroa destructor]